MKCLLNTQNAKNITNKTHCIDAILKKKAQRQLIYRETLQEAKTNLLL